MIKIEREPSNFFELSALEISDLFAHFQEQITLTKLVRRRHFNFVFVFVSLLTVQNVLKFYGTLLYSVVAYAK
jgi:hypothetical protein